MFKFKNLIKLSPFTFQSALKPRLFTPLALPFSSAASFPPQSNGPLQVKDLLGMALELNQAENAEGALEYYRKALEVLQNIVHTQPSACQERLAMAEIHLRKGSIHYLQNNLEPALENFTKAKDLFLDCDGQSPAVAECYDNIGSIHYEKGNYLQSLEYYYKAVEIYHHYQMSIPLVKIYHEMSVTFTAMGMNQEALDILRDCVKIRVKAGEEFHEETADAYMILGEALKNEQKYSEAIQSFNEALKIRTKLFGEKDSSLAECYVNLGSACGAEGNLNKASQYITKSIQLNKKAKDDLKVANDHITLGDLYCKNDHFEKAIEHYQSALKINKKHVKNGSMDSSYCHYKLGGVFMRLKEFNSAAKHLEEGIKLTLKKSAQAGRGPQLYEFYEMLGLVYFEQQKFVQAKQYYNEALELCVKKFGAESSELNQLYMALGSINSLLNNFTEAVEYYENVLASQEKSLGEDNYNLGYTYHGIANTYYRQRDMEKAIYNHKKALGYLIPELGLESDYIATLYFDLAAALKEKGSLAESVGVLQQGMEIIVRKHGAGHNEMGKFTRELEKLYKKQGDLENLNKLQSFIRL